MFGTVMFTYGVLTSFVLSGASQNRRLRRPNPPIMNHVAHVLFGMSAAASVLLSGYAAWGAVSV